MGGVCVAVSVMYVAVGIISSERGIVFCNNQGDQSRG